MRIIRIPTESYINIIFFSQILFYGSEVLLNALLI
jgi:hypothetical protein